MAHYVNNVEIVGVVVNVKQKEKFITYMSELTWSEEKFFCNSTELQDGFIFFPSSYIIYALIILLYDCPLLHTLVDDGTAVVQCQHWNNEFPPGTHIRQQQTKQHNC
jgi:hypothetical protein